MGHKRAKSEGDIFYGGICDPNEDDDSECGEEEEVFGSDPAMSMSTEVKDMALGRKITPYQVRLLLIPFQLEKELELLIRAFNTSCLCCYPVSSL